jgi:hypothetical protein
MASSWGMRPHRLVWSPGPGESEGISCWLFDWVCFLASMRAEERALKVAQAEAEARARR